jgi:hypothetical protein
MAGQRLTPAQARDRRAKIAAGVLGVVLLGALALQGPKLLKMIHKSSPPVSSSAVNVAPVGSAANAAAATASGAETLAASTTATTPGQLTGLGRFPLKDPFYAQNVTTTTAASAAPPAPAPASTKTAATTTTAAPTAGSTTPSTTPAATTTAATTTAATTTAATTPAATTPTTPAPSVPFTTSGPVTPPNAVVLLTNGEREIISVGQSFPTEAPLFKLNGLSTHKDGSSIRVSVLGGSFTDGVHSVGIDTGKTITFANESDGTKYVIKVVRLTNVAAPAGGSASPAATTTAATTSATTTTASGSSSKG